MIEYVDETGSIINSVGYCICELYNNVFLLGKKIRTYIFGKKDM